MGKIEIDYKELIEDITMEINEGVITLDTSIQILRSKEAVFEGYCPIIDWYYEEFAMEEEINTPLEEMYLPEEFSEEEWKEMKSSQDELRKQYYEDKPDLLYIKVKEALTEMKQIQKLTGKMR